MTSPLPARVLVLRTNQHIAHSQYMIQQHGRELVSVYWSQGAAQTRRHGVRGEFGGGVANQRKEDARHLFGAGVVWAPAMEGEKDRAVLFVCEDEGTICEQVLGLALSWGSQLRGKLISNHKAIHTCKSALTIS